MKLDERYTYINYLVNELEFINGKVFKYNKEIDYYDEIKNIRKYLLGILRNRGMVASKSDLDFICDSVWEYADNEKRWYDSKIVHQARKLGTLPVDTPLVFELDKKQLQLINKMLFHPEEELLIITTGVGGSGKSTFLNIVKQLFDNDCSFATLSDLSNEFMLAESIKHRIICSTELAKGEIDCRKIKQLVSKEPIMINPKHKTPEERMTQSVLFFCCNKAPKIDVTVPTASSTGEKIVLAIKSQKIQNTQPVKNTAGIATIGLAVFNNFLAICGTAIPTKEIGPTKAAATALSKLLSKIIIFLKALTLIPIF